VRGDVTSSSSSISNSVEVIVIIIGVEPQSAMNAAIQH